VQTASSEINYPYYRMYDNRYWFDDNTFLYERFQKSDEKSDIDCIKQAIKIVPQSVYHYSHYYGRDIKILTDIENVPHNVGMIIFSNRLNDESKLLPSGGTYSEMLYLSSLIKRMCPNVSTRNVYHSDKNRQYYDYIIFQIQE
jgi:hypothetical protein